MKVKKIKHKHKVIIISIVIFIILAGSTCIFLYANNFFKQKSKLKKTTTTTSSTTTKAGATGIGDVNNGTGSDQPASPTTISGSSLKKVQVMITSINQTDSAVQIRAIVYALDSSGTCTLKLQRDGYNTITQTASLQNSATTSTCKGFTISKSAIDSGVWQLTITYLSDTLTGSISNDVTIN